MDLQLGAANLESDENQELRRLLSRLPAVAHRPLAGRAKAAKSPAGAHDHLDKLVRI